MASLPKPKRITSYMCSNADWVMMERLVSEHRATGGSRIASKQQVIDEALALYRPKLVAEYERVFGVSPPSDD